MHNPQTLHITTLDGDWCDKDQAILHACFQLLTDFVEKEKIDEIVDWETDEVQSKARKEIGELYDWWKQRVIADAEGKIDEIWDNTQRETDDNMLIRLIKVRRYLWT